MLKVSNSECLTYTKIKGLSINTSSIGLIKTVIVSIILMTFPITQWVKETPKVSRFIFIIIKKEINGCEYHYPSRETTGTRKKDIFSKGETYGL